MSNEQKSFKTFEFPKADSLKSDPALVFQIIQQSISNSLAASLTRLLKQQTKISLTESMETNFSTLHKTSKEKKSVLVLLKFQEIRFPFILQLDNDLVSQVLNCMSGGKPNKPALVMLPLSKLSEKGLNRFCETIGEEMAKAWSRLFKTKDYRFKHYELNELRGSYKDEDKFLTATYEFEIGGVRSHMIIYISSYFSSLIKQNATRPQIKSANEAPPWTKWIAKHVFETQVELRALLGEAEVLVGDLLNLGEGDVIVLDQKADQGLRLMVEGQHKYDVKAGVAGAQRAVRILFKRNNAG